MNTHTRKTGGQAFGFPGAFNGELDKTDAPGGDGVNPGKGPTGLRFWRGLEQLAETEEFRQYLYREFPENATEWTDPDSRRHFLKLMGASLALAGVGLSGCGKNSPSQKILPYVRQPEGLVQGKPLLYATAISVGGVGTGVVAESHEGRPTMLEGNPKHPDSLGSIDALTQASILGLYDPDRSKVVTKANAIGTLDAFLEEAAAVLDAARARKGEGVRLLTGTVTSPTLARQIRAFLEEFPAARWHQYEPAGPHAASAGARLAFGSDVSTHYHLDQADVILALDSDFLGGGHGHLRTAREFAHRREPGTDGSKMNRLYSVEPTVSVTGSSADHRLRVKASDVVPLARALAVKLGVAGVTGPAPLPPGVKAKWLDALAADLKSHAGRCLVVVGEGQPGHAHALGHAMNAALGNVGKTVTYAEPVEAEPGDQVASLVELAGAMDLGSVKALFIFGGNPVYDAPADSGFVRGLAKVLFKARLGLYDDETSALCDWHIPETHELETWGDVRGSDGTVTIQQPLIAPLYGQAGGVQSAVLLLASLLRDPDPSGYEIVRATWLEKAPKGQNFEAFWKASLNDGVVAGTTLAPVSPTLKADLGPPPPAPKAEGLEVVFRPDPTVFDGRFNNNGWLQELPKPLTKLTWDNAAILSPATAERLGLTVVEAGSDVVELTLDGRKVDAPVWILPGQADDVVTLHLGYGRARTGRVGTGAGFNAYALRTASAPLMASGLSLRKIPGQVQRLATTQMHGSLEGRDLYRIGTVSEYKEHADFAHHEPHAESHEPARDNTIIPPEAPDYVPDAHDYQWGMTVDLNTCTGCGNCTLACVAENNIAVVGREQVKINREMHWLEVDRYFAGDDPNDPQVYHQPRLCMHCEKAPCEVVCPVAATVHDHEGLNLMVYNRCVGTRYCSNNCPYKVRHFNFLQYADLKTPSIALRNNPDVTVRARGVMEKCTYCIQRINQGRYTAELEGRRIRDGDVVTACQSACPTQAIVFGDISDPNSRVSKLKADPRNFGMLAELNTRPRTTYLAKVRNPNPEIETPTAAKTEAHHG